MSALKPGSPASQAEPRKIPQSPSKTSTESPPRKEDSGTSASKTSHAPGKKKGFGAQKSVVKVPTYVAISRVLVNNKYFIGFTTLLTVYALTGDDIRLICTRKPADMIFNYIVMLCIVVFSFEVVVSCLGKDDYFMGFFFVLDVASTATLVLDLSWVSDELAGGGEDDDQAKNARAGRTARIGAKAGRVVRVIRLVRILKLYKAIYEAKQKKKEAEMRALNAADDDDWDDVDIEKGDEEASPGNESRVGKKLSEMTTRRVIILVLIMLLVLPQLRPEQSDQLAVSAFYGADHVWDSFMGSLNSSTPTSKEDYEKSMLQYVYYHNWFAGKGYCAKGNDCAGMYYSHLFWIGVTGSDLSIVSSKVADAQLQASTVTAWDAEVKTQQDIYNYGWMPNKVLQVLSSPWTQRCDTSTKKRLGLSLLSAEVDDVVDYTVDCPEDLRIGEQKKYWARMQTFEEYDVWYFAFYFDLREFSRMDAAFNLCITFFVCIVLCVASMYFSSDANNLVLKPVENMIKRVEAIRENPLIAMKMADEEFKAEEVAKAKEKKRAKERISNLAKDAYRCQGIFKKATQEPMETVILEKTIIKLGSLLALGFGEAGANIIGDNMKGADSAGVNAMVPGVKVECIIGIVRIRDFSTATEVLQTKIMTFVNQIAEIVHGVVDEYHGAANKNNGDMFLIIWRLEGVDVIRKTRMAEMSVVAFAKILGSLHTSSVLAEYREHPGLQQRLGSDCRVNLNIGLHCGWAIEGAVGSEFKIDASYLSPNVSIATSIERATLMYGVPLMIAQSVHELCGEDMAEKCRLIDRVVITGSTIPMKLYALDLAYQDVDVDINYNRPVWNTRQRYRARQFLETAKNNKVSPEIPTVTFFNSDDVIKEMRRLYTVAFFQLFNMGYQNYSQGEWAVAKRLLNETLSMLPFQDGPSDALLRFMETSNYTAPKNWTGVREWDRHATDIN